MMEKFKLYVTMEYYINDEIEAETYEEAVQAAKNKAGDGYYVRDMDIVSVDAI